jgi:hypothetical protein
MLHHMPLEVLLEHTAATVISPVTGPALRWRPGSRPYCRMYVGTAEVLQSVGEITFHQHSTQSTLGSYIVPAPEHERAACWCVASHIQVHHIAANNGVMMADGAASGALRAVDGIWWI